MKYKFHFIYKMDMIFNTEEVLKTIDDLDECERHISDIKIYIRLE